MVIVYRIKDNKSERVETVTFSEISMSEREIEEVLRKNIDILCNEEESMLMVGSQVKNEQLGRSDLTAVGDDGSIVLIEIKRDKKDIVNRSEAFEFQAIRYAASYATIDTPDELVKKVYSPYIEKHSDEFELGDLTSYELGIRKLEEFLQYHEAVNTFNRKQRIILAASDFDEQTLSAVACLNSNNVDISCFKLIPYRIHDEKYVYPERVLPIPEYDDYYVNLLDRKASLANRKTSLKRRSLPRIDSLLDWGLVHPGDIIIAKNKGEEATLLGNGNVLVDDDEMSLQIWLKEVFGWSSVQTYTLSVHKDSGKTLSQIRREYMIDRGTYPY